VGLFDPFRAVHGISRLQVETHLVCVYFVVEISERNVPPSHSTEKLLSVAFQQTNVHIARKVF
jgi:hypothetical protein